MTCPYCGRSDIEPAISQNGGFHFKSIEIDPDLPKIKLSINTCCIDCAQVMEHFVRKGILGFRKMLKNRTQLDLFEDAKIPAVTRYISRK